MTVCFLQIKKKEIKKLTSIKYDTYIHDIKIRQVVNVYFLFINLSHDFTSYIS